MITRHRRTLAGAIVVLSLVTAACSDDDDGEDAAATTTTEAEAEPVELDDDWCVAWGQVDEYLDSDDATAEGVQAHFDAFAEVAPEGAAQGAQQLAPAVVDAFEGGDFLAMASSPEFDEGFEAVDAALLDECGFADLSVTAAEYEYTGVPGTLTAGEYLLDLQNDGNELHEAILHRLADDESRPMEDVLAELDDAEEIGESFAVPTRSGYSSAVTLEPGRYVVACFIPVGLTPEVAEASEEGGPEPDGDPHYTQGMYAEITVE